ncbi:hypothetical protein BW723_03380 [Polaribacter reichenbachii]|uniref:LamG-like jellyroll fold domain-containing protein n=1 Tax=Polaribacter reichenbachii TaxID=996801 RepID=A0A1B8TVH9_9FLAO|nr:LamG domain-containing protein [Polaribacter reichenbachii]APZ45401.1 hypothetical protein BW723_03380 [Polaribacter reichenbachii]AUC19262.1 hypothetical protein BTO17_11385 [Polaribacter reichenbachii]OBY63582.1 hypothetical protein LPB301_12320 [Polaribacter reichenbachii]
MKFNFSILFFILFLIFGCKHSSEKKGISNQFTEWIVADLLEEKSENVVINGNPKLVDYPYGKAVNFNGVDDALFLDQMPLKGATSFTIEMVFNPSDIEAPFEQRILHLGEVSKDRMLLEIRAVENNWYFDGFVASGNNKRALIDEKLIHPLGQWYHVALVITPNSITTYVNGKKELEDVFSFKPINTGKSSLGVRLNKRSWFKGSIFKVRISPKALQPNNFISLEKLIK